MVMLVCRFGQWSLFSERCLLDELDAATVVFLDCSEDIRPGRGPGEGRKQPSPPLGLFCEFRQCFPCHGLSGSLLPQPRPEMSGRPEGRVARQALVQPRDTVTGQGMFALQPLGLALWSGRGPCWFWCRRAQGVLVVGTGARPLAPGAGRGGRCSDSRPHSCPGGI